MRARLALLSFEIFTILLPQIGLPLLYQSTKNGEIRCHQFVEIANDLHDTRKSVIGHESMHKSLSISCNIQK